MLLKVITYARKEIPAINENGFEELNMLLKGSRSLPVYMFTESTYSYGEITIL